VSPALFVSAQDDAQAEGSDEASPSVDDADLIRRTLPADIRTASFYDLVDWARRLDLSTRGDRRDIQNRLAEYYDISQDELRPPTAEDEGREVVIESANESEYFSLDQVNEDYVRLRGGVRLRTTQENETAVHTIEAEEIVFNRNENSLTASGNVRYRIDREGEVEEFTGNTLSFQLDSWEGQFLEGVSSRERDVEGEEIRFRYSGDYMTRTEGDIVVMEDGEISSSTATPPSYSIRAERIWVFGAGEWAIRRARLYVGRVPIVAFPFFFKPGDQVFFNPVFGTKDREGAFLQTTTYVVGEKETEESTISFLQVGDDEAAGPREREGLFLVPAQGNGESASGGGSEPGTVKVLFDMYAKLGAYTGVEAELSRLGPIRSISGRAGIGVSRHLYPGNAGGGAGDTAGLTPYYVTDGEAVSDWNTSSFLDLQLPFRYLVDVDLSAREAWASGSGALELYSDPYVDLDFGSRAEDMDWIGLISGDEDEASGTGFAAEKRRLRWRSSLRLNPSLSFLSPYIGSLSIREIGASLDWRSRKRSDPTPEISEADRSPEETFFYPTRSVFPSVGLSMSGTLLDLPRQEQRSDQATRNEEGRRIEAPFRPPWDAGTEPEANEEGKGEEAGSVPPVYRLPSLRPGSRGLEFPDPFGADLGYRINSTSTIENSYDDDEWERPAEVGFQYAYSSATTNNSARLNYGTTVLERLISFDGSVEASGRYREIYNQADPDNEQTRSIVKQAARYSSLIIQNDASASVAPLPKESAFGASKLEYRLGADLFRLVFDDEASGTGEDFDPVYRNERVKWDKEYVDSHSIEAQLQTNINDNRQRLSVSTSLPPLDRSYRSTLNTAFGFWSATLRLSAKESDESSGGENSDGEFVFDPLSFSQRLSFGDTASLSQSAIYDMEEGFFERVTMEVAGAVGSANVRFRRSRDVEFDSGFIEENRSSPWIESDNESLRPASAQANLSYELPSLLLWRNRISVEAGARSGIEADLQRFTDSNLSLRTEVKVGIHEFLEFSLSSSSQNNFIYRYIPVLAARVQREPRSLLGDLLRSFNFFKREDREESFFNLQRLSLSATHRLGDWDLVLSYSGRPSLLEERSPPEYEWDTELAITVQWRPLPELKSEVTYEDEEFQYETGQ